MKILSSIIAAALFTFSASAQPFTVDLATPHSGTNVVGTTTNVYTYYGDPLAVIFTKVNSNNVFFADLAAAQTVQITTLSNSLYAASNSLWTVTAAHASLSLQVGTNTATIGSLGGNLTNLVAATGLDLTNRLNTIQVVGSSGSEIVLKIVSPDGSIWYEHVDNSGVLTVTNTP